MREIEFRGKQCKTGKWLFGNLDIHKNYKDAKDPIYGINYDGDENCCGFLNADWDCIDGETVGQYTGLKDRNGVKIFEGDIVRYGLKAYDDDNEAFIDEPIQSVIEWGGDYPAFDIREHDFDCNALHGICCQSEYLIEVIGNIHDNPELVVGGRENGA